MTKVGIVAILTAINEGTSQCRCDSKRSMQGARESGDNSRIDIATKGGIEAVLAAMKEHPKDRKVQEEACAALWNLSRHNDNNKIEIAAKGGIDASVAAMKEHLKFAEVQEEACGALWILSALMDNRIMIVANGGIEAILEAMKEHLNVAAVQKAGMCGAVEAESSQSQQRT